MPSPGPMPPQAPARGERTSRSSTRPAAVQSGHRLWQGSIGAACRRRATRMARLGGRCGSGPPWVPVPGRVSIAVPARNRGAHARAVGRPSAYGRPRDPACLRNIASCRARPSACWGHNPSPRSCSRGECIEKDKGSICQRTRPLFKHQRSKPRLMALFGSMHRAGAVVPARTNRREGPGGKPM